MNHKIASFIVFEIKRTIKPLFILIIIPMSLLLIGILYQFHLNSLLTPSNEYLTFNWSIKLFKFLQQFITSIYAIVICSYLLNDRSILFIIQFSGNRYLPYILKFITALIISIVLSIYLIFLYTTFALLFLQIIPNFSLILTLTILSLFEIICFSTLTFFGSNLFYRFHLQTQIAYMFPIILLYVFPAFIYSGISYGVFPDFLNSITLQYNLTQISNFLLPAIDSYRPSIEGFFSSVLLGFSVIIIAFGGGIFLIRDFEFQ